MQTSKIIKSFIITFLIISPLLSQSLDNNPFNENTSVVSRGLAGSGVAKANDLSLMNINPAALNSINEFSMYYYTRGGFYDSSLNYLSIGFQAFKQKFAISSLLYKPDYIIERNSQGTISQPQIYDLSSNINWANSIKINNSFIRKGLFEYGAGIKTTYSKLLDYNVFGGSFNFGATLRIMTSFLKFLPFKKLYNLSFGYSVQNLGPDIQYGVVSAKQPLRSRFGFIYNLLATRHHDISVMLNGTTNQDWDFSSSIALEYTIVNFINLRLGYFLADLQRSYSLGFATILANWSSYKLKLHYAMEAFKIYDYNNHYVGFSFDYTRNPPHQDYEEAINEGDYKRCYKN